MTDEASYKIAWWKEAGALLALLGSVLFIVFILHSSWSEGNEYVKKMIEDNRKARKGTTL